jgi:hypothetical protein
MIESRWPTLADAEVAMNDLNAVRNRPRTFDLTQKMTITATLTGELPASPHALCDLLDKEATRVAHAQGMIVIAIAGDATSGEVVHDGRTVPALSREYWAVPG